jgi:uncharacterized protein Yka (UPF0111/DUF47 family)
METQAFAAFAQYGALGLIALGAAYGAWKIIHNLSSIIREISERLLKAIENNTAAMTLLGERMTDVERAVERLDGRLENVENAIDKES